MYVVVFLVECLLWSSSVVDCCVLNSLWLGGSSRTHQATKSSTMSSVLVVDYFADFQKNLRIYIMRIYLCRGDVRGYTLQITMMVILNSIKKISSKESFNQMDLDQDRTAIFFHTENLLTSWWFEGLYLPNHYYTHFELDLKIMFSFEKSFKLKWHWTVQQHRYDNRSITLKHSRVSNNGSCYI